MGAKLGKLATYLRSSTLGYMTLWPRDQTWGHLINISPLLTDIWPLNLTG